MRGKTLLVGTLGTGLVIGLGVLGQQLIFGASRDRDRVPAPATATAPDPTANPSADAGERDAGPRFESLVVTAPGALERQAGGQWVAVASGSRLAVTDRIRTQGEGAVTLEAADGSRIELVDEVEVTVEALTRSLAELELHRGRLRADLADGSDMALRVTSSGASAEAQNGAFVVFADGTGMVAVASETAEVRLRAQEREVLVAAGQQSLVRPDGPPSDPEAIPEAVFLEVAWPQGRVQRERRLVVRGRVDPGTEVRIEDRSTSVAHDGTFETEVALSEGVNRVAVRARDIAGRTKTAESPAVMVKTRPPPLEVLSQGHWNGVPQ
jgi:hypothetical protein